MKPNNLILTTLLLLALTLAGQAQERLKLELNPKAPKAEPVKIEQINNQDILRIASPTDTIRIPLSDDIWSKIENLMQSNVGAELALKDIEGADVHLVRVTKNMKPGVYFRNKKKTSISVLNQEIEIIRLKEY